ncbi:MAG: glycosyltransferase [Synechococcales bacterium]|nr:glycosyltransferase [Synechococcales bacterium]
MRDDACGLQRVLMLGPGLQVMGGISSVERLLVAYPPTGVEYVHISTLEDGPAVRKLQVFAIALYRLLQHLIGGRIDLVHIHFSKRGSTLRKSILMMLVLLWGKPCILHAHGSEFRSFFQSLPVLLQEGVGWLFRRCDRFIALSESWRTFYQDALHLEAHQIVVLPNPVELPPQVPDRTDQNGVRFVFLGRIGERKGAYALIRAFAQVQATASQPIHLTLAGDGEVEAARQLVATLGVESQVCVMDWVSPEQRDALLADAHVFVLPSSNEGLPMSLLEAMGWGLAVITTPVGGIPEVVTDAVDGLLVTPGDVAGLAAAMRSLIENPPYRQQLGAQARARVTPLDIRNYTKVLRQVYDGAGQSWPVTPGVKPIPAGED